MRALPAAAIQKGDTVRLPAGTDSTVEVEVLKVHNGTPIAGRVTWEVKGSPDIEIGASVRVEVVKL